MKKILVLSFFVFAVMLFGYTNINDFETVPADPATGPDMWGLDGSPNDYELMVDTCTKYPHEYYPSWRVNESSDGYIGQSLEIHYTNRKKYGATAISYEFSGDDTDLSAFNYLMLYVKGGESSEVLNVVILENNSADSNGPWMKADDIWAYEGGVFGQTNWKQLLLPINTSVFSSSSEQWNSVCEPAKFRQINKKIMLTNTAGFQLAIVSPVASPSSPRSGVAYFDNFILLNSSELVHASNPNPVYGAATTNTLQPISLDIGANMSNVRMIVNNVEYKTNDSHLTYDGQTVTFVPTSPFSDVVNVYVDAIYTLTGVPMVAEKWWFFIGEDTKSDHDVIKNLTISEYFNEGNAGLPVHLYLAARGNLEISLFSLSGKKIDVIKSFNDVDGSLDFEWNGKISGASPAPGLYLIEFKYVSQDGITQKRRIKTIQIIR